MNELHLFAGAGGGILGGELLGHTTVCAVEIEEYPRKVLLQRQRDGILPKFPIWDDITTFDGRPWKGAVDIVSGGFPCQDISAAGKGAGIDGERSGLWGEMARVINEVRPRFAFVENSPMLTSRGLGRVLGDLAEMGYNARWCVLGADDVGSPHRRKRIWILAYPMQSSGSTQQGEQQEIRPNRIIGSSKIRTADVADSMQDGLQGKRENRGAKRQVRLCSGEGRDKKQSISWWDEDPADISDSDKKLGRGEGGGIRGRSKNEINRDETQKVESIMGRVANGVVSRVDRLKAIGNGQVPAVAALAFTVLSEGII